MGNIGANYKLSKQLKNTPKNFKEIPERIKIKDFNDTQLNTVKKIKAEDYSLDPSKLDKTYIGKVRNNFFIKVRNSDLSEKEK